MPALIQNGDRDTTPEHDDSSTEDGLESVEYSNSDPTRRSFGDASMISTLTNPSFDTVTPQQLEFTDDTTGATDDMVRGGMHLIPPVLSSTTDDTTDDPSGSHAGSNPPSTISVD